MKHRKRRVALVNALVRNEKTVEIPVECMGLAYLCAVLREKDYEVDIYDPYITGETIGELASKLLSGNYFLIGFSLMSMDYFENMKKILMWLDESDKKLLDDTAVVTGGYYATVRQEKILEACGLVDYVIYGEGEQSILLLAETLSNGSKDLDSIPNLIFRKDKKIIKTESMRLFEDLDKLPFPARDTLPDIIKKNDSAIVISTSRGCYGRCDYCAVHNMYDRFEGSVWRSRSPENVADEIEKLVKEFNVKNIHFMDDDFIGPGKKGQDRAIAIANEILKRKLKISFYALTRVNNVTIEVFEKLKEAGLYKVFLGIEFGCQKFLDFYNKKTTVEQNIEAINILKNLGLETVCGYIMFEPAMSIDEFKQNFDFYVQYVPEFNPGVLTRKLHIYPASKAYESLKDKIAIEEEQRFHPVIGSYHRYKFLHSEIYVLYQALRNMLESLLTYKFEDRLSRLDTYERNAALMNIKQAIIPRVEYVISYLKSNDVYLAAKELPNIMNRYKYELMELIDNKEI